MRRDPETERLRAEIDQLNAELSRRTAEMARFARGEAHYRTVIESSDDFIFALDPAGRVVYVNEKGARQFGQPREAFAGRTLETLFPPEIAARQRANLERVLADRRPLVFEGISAIGGRAFWLNTRLTPILGDDGQVATVVGISRDVTERKAFQDALVASEKRLRDLIDHAFEGIGIHVDGVVVEANEALCRIHGRTRDEMIGRPVAEGIAPESLASVLDVDLEGPMGPVEIWALRRDGSRVAVEAASMPFTYEGRPARLAVVRDVTDRKRLEEERRKAEKLESIGRLAGGIAHDFNNILTALLGNMVLARRDAPEGSRLHDRLGEAEKALDRATDLTRQLLTFSRGGAPIRKTVAIGTVVRESAGFAASGSAAQLSVRVADDLWPVEADAGQLGQVVHNLVVNAVQAMAGGGQVRVSCENCLVTAGQGCPVEAGRWVRVAVEDDGIGIPASNLPHIFEPYFTTKPGGSGLGLATSYSIVRNHDGRIDVRSEPGCGTRFHVWLPASERRVPGQGGEPGAAPSGRGRLLVMDDEAGIRNVFREMAKALGYEVVQAADGAEAVAAHASALAAGTPYDVIVTDLTVRGGMGGVDAARQIRSVDDRVRLVATSGYSNDPVMSDPGRYGFDAVLPKPYNLRTLGEVLGRPRGA